MDINMIKNKLDSLQPKKKEYEKVDYTALYWKPKTEGKHQVRIVPSKFDKAWPFKEVYLHYGFANFPIYALNNWGEEDPIMELASELRKTNEGDDWKLAKQLDPKMRVFAQVVVRGEEDKGVRLWEFGKQVYQTLLNLAEDEDYGDFTDITNGLDFVVTAEKSDMNGRQVLKVASVTPKRKESQLSEDPKQVEDWLENQNDILELQSKFKKKYDELKEILRNFLNPEDPEDEGDTPTKPSDFDKDENSTPESNYSLSTKDTSKKVDKFDKMFEEGEGDDLPF